MNDSECKKSNEALADDALDDVTGGALGLIQPQTLTAEELTRLLAGQQEEGQRKR